MNRKESMRRTVGLIVKTEVLFHRLLERQVSHTGVFPSQHRLLMELDRNPACAQMELAEKFGVSAAAITVSLKKLERRLHQKKGGPGGRPGESRGDHA